MYDSRKLNADGKRSKDPVMVLRRYMCMDCNHTKKTIEDLT